MRFSQSSFVYLNYPLQEAIRRLHNIGYQGIEVWGGRPHAYRRDLDGQVQEITDILSDCGMVVCNFIPAQFRYPSILCSSNENIRVSSVEYIKDAIDTAARLGSPYVSLCPGMAIYGEDLNRAWNQLAKSIRELLSYSSSYDLTLLIEPAHPAESNVIRTVGEALKMIEDTKPGKLGILLDTGHIRLNQENFLEAVSELRSVPFHIHIDDNNGDNDAHLIPGEGSIDFRSFASALKRLDYGGFVSAELAFQYAIDPDYATKKTLNFLKQLFDA